MATDKPLDGCIHEEVSFRSFLSVKLECSRSILSSGTADENFSFIFAVKIHKHAACHEVWLHANCAGKAGLFVAGEHALYRTVLNIVTVKNSHFDSASYTVICSKGCSFRFQPFSVNICLDRVFREVDIYINKLLAHHVHMTLEDYCLPILKSLSRLVNHSFKVS